MLVFGVSRRLDIQYLDEHSFPVRKIIILPDLDPSIRRFDEMETIQPNVGGITAHTNEFGFAIAVLKSIGRADSQVGARSL
ncbi:hypothetical protein C451_20430 [Halococcus thailandensis JCM 13552]|uniref:Uncharacterized protein n=1 Tax=Halococcus thailandensis JCM 13552 TaxID=1227457 RepID=M0MVK3_9EURY|nr:hypothetical protein C451_20430 [Halococcus thailandensis JCM 13552]